MTRLTLFCMIKPFSWEYPAVVYSKDEELLEAPFPLICGISRELFLKTRCGETAAAAAGKYVFDLDKFEFVLLPKEHSISKREARAPPRKALQQRQEPRALFRPL